MRNTKDSQIIKTKLYRPPLTKDHLHRQRLLDLLDKHWYLPLTLVSAPAGYGKSTLVSCWLNTINIPSAYVSLDENDNDLRLFLSYFLAAIRTIFPGSCPEIEAMINSTDLPPVSVLTPNLINALDQIEKEFILVLDDYHSVHEQAIHNLLSDLLCHPPKPLHLVIVTRRDPPLHLSTFRASGKMTEIRIRELRFSAKETAEFLQNTLQKSFGETMAANVEKHTEGWVAGLRIIALFLQQKEDAQNIFSLPKGDSPHIMDYLFNEVILKQPKYIQEYLLITSILDRFCASLCQAVCMPGTEPGVCEIGGADFLTWLKHSNLFLISLDDQQRWFRHHHLFQQVLQQKLKDRFSTENIALFHKRAAEWFAENGILEEAFRHFLSSGDTQAASRLVADHRHYIMNREQWNLLDRLLNLLPEEIIYKSPELLLARIWLYENRARISEVISLFGQCEAIVEGLVANGYVVKKHLRGEVDALASACHYLRADGEAAIACSTRALETISPDNASALGFALVVLALAKQMTGDHTGAIQVLIQSLSEAESRGTTYKGRLLAGFCFIYWMEGDLDNVNQTAVHYLDIGKRHHLPESRIFAEYFLGIVAYQLNDLTAAEHYLTSSMEESKFVNFNNFAQSVFALSLTHSALGHSDQAQRIIESLINLSFDTGNSDIFQTAKAFQSELVLRTGKVTKDTFWIEQKENEPFIPVYRCYSPYITAAKILIVHGTSDSWERAITFLERLRGFFTSTHNTPLLIEVLALQALLYDAQGTENAALSALHQAITLAKPGGFIRLFIDLGSRIANMLRQLAIKNIEVNYIGKILSAFRDQEQRIIHDLFNHQTVQSSSKTNKISIEPLTNRELEILALLAQRLSNKEIAKKLSISSDTVKRHTITIYQKLNVHNRKEASAKAKSLGFFSQS